MASIRNLKKDILFITGTIIEAVHTWEIITEQPNSEPGTRIITEAAAIMNDLMAKVNDKKVPDRRAHLKAVRRELEEKARALIGKLNTLD